MRKQAQKKDRFYFGLCTLKSRERNETSPLIKSNLVRYTEADAN